MALASLSLPLFCVVVASLSSSRSYGVERFLSHGNGSLGWVDRNLILEFEGEIGVDFVSDASFFSAKENK